MVNNMANDIRNLERRLDALEKMYANEQNHYVYLVREREFVGLNEDTFKAGVMTETDPTDHFDRYTKGTEIICFMNIKKYNRCMERVQDAFSEHFIRRDDYGEGYFTGDRDKMISVLVDLIKLYKM